MKREHTTQSNPLLEWLKSKNCILYSPLSYDDTSDWISGNAIELYNSNSMVWDSVHNIWKFQKVGSQSGMSSYFAKWQLKDTLAYQTLDFTAICQFRAYYDYLGNGRNNVYDLYSERIGLSFVGQLNTECQCAQVFPIINGHSRQLQYRNGTQVSLTDYSSILNIPSNTTGIRIGTPDSGGSFAGVAAGPYGVRNFAVFLQVFTLSEINEYFNLI